MGQLKACAALAALLLVGCAAGPEPQTGAPASAAMPAAEDAETGERLASSTLSLDAEALEQVNPIVCKQMLQHASNVIVRRCMSQADWRMFERAQELRARQMLRMMQGSAYR